VQLHPQTLSQLHLVMPNLHSSVNKLVPLDSSSSAEHGTLVHKVSFTSQLVQTPPPLTSQQEWDQLWHGTAALFQRHPQV
jgi:hypothetical protein